MTTLDYAVQHCFNTQPPEGGWAVAENSTQKVVCFNTQPPEGGWPRISTGRTCGTLFQHTAARRRLDFRAKNLGYRVCFNTQPPEGGWVVLLMICGWFTKFQHTAARRRLG